MGRGRPVPWGLREGRAAQRGQAQRAAGSVSRSRAPQLSGDSRRPAVGFSPSRPGDSRHGPGPTAPRDVRGPERLLRHAPPVTSRPQLARCPRVGAARGCLRPCVARARSRGFVRAHKGALFPAAPGTCPPAPAPPGGGPSAPPHHRRLPWPWGRRCPPAAPGGRQPPPACCGICAAICLG